MRRKKSEHSAKRALKALARKKGMSLDVLQNDIEEAMEFSRKSYDQNVHAFWNSVPCKGKLPTQVETIAYLAEMTRDAIHS